MTQTRNWKQTGMAEDFPNTISKTVGVPKAFFESKTSPGFLSEHKAVA